MAAQHKSSLALISEMQSLSSVIIEPRYRKVSICSGGCPRHVILTLIFFSAAAIIFVFLILISRPSFPDVRFILSMSSCSAFDKAVVRTISLAHHRLLITHPLMVIPVPGNLF